MNGSVDLQILLFDVGNSFFHYLFVNMLAATLYMLCVTISAKEVMQLPCFCYMLLLRLLLLSANVVHKRKMCHDILAAVH